MLCGLTFPTNQEILSDPNIWIADTAATVHNTPHGIGMSHIREANKNGFYHYGQWHQ
jgi:hypothetical protein